MLLCSAKYPGMNSILLIVCLLAEFLDGFKLPDFNTNIDTDVENSHDHFRESIVNSTVTSINLSVIHVTSEILLLIILICSHRRLSGLIHRVSLALVRQSSQSEAARRVTSV